jgi:hypothetical protein
MTDTNDLLDHAVELFPAPTGALDELYRRQARHHRQRRVVAGAAVLAVWFALAAVVITIGTRDGAVPADPSPSPSDRTEIVVDAELPAWFPANLPLPPGAVPVAHREGQRFGYADGDQVWFRSDMRQREIHRWFLTNLGLDGSRPWVGWSPDGNSAALGGIWDLHARSTDHHVIILARTDPNSRRLIHGSADFEGSWDFYVSVKDRVPSATPTAADEGLPLSFAGFPVPIGSEPIEIRDGELRDQVWFRSDMTGTELNAWYTASLPKIGWSGGELGLDPSPMHLDLRSGDRHAAVIASRNATVLGAHDSGAFEGEWDFYVFIREPGPRLP